MWDDRFSQSEYVYGTSPNDFLVSQASVLPKRRVLSIGEGEGRNAVYLATRGFEVTALDGSRVGLDKARTLAQHNNVELETIHADLSTYVFDKNHWGSVVSIFCHLPRELRRRVHRQIVDALVDGGVFVMEAYTPRQLVLQTGGPKSEELLVHPDELTSELEGLELEVFRSVEREIHEGSLHNGLSAVVQVLARKRSH